MTNLRLIETENYLSDHLQELAQTTKQYMDASLSPATRKAYASDWQIFADWCYRHGFEPLPASSDVVAMFLSDQAKDGIAPSTLTRRTAAIKLAHESAGHASPTVAKSVATTLKGIRKTNTTPKKPKAPATVDRIAAMIDGCPDTLTGLRDRALLLLGFAGAFRRSELVALIVEDLEETPEGLRITIRQSKTDQEGAGHVIAIPNSNGFRVVSALKAWLKSAGIQEGYLFRPVTKYQTVRDQGLTDRSVATIVKKYAGLAGLNEDAFSGHSLRSGFLTSAAENGANVFKMMEVSRHRSVETLRNYVRSADLFKDHAGSRFL